MWNQVPGTINSISTKLVTSVSFVLSSFLYSILYFIIICLNYCSNFLTGIHFFQFLSFS